MLGRKTYEPDELENARTSMTRQLAAYDALAAGADPEALAAFEPLLMNNLVKVLDREFVHRVRSVTGKDSNPLNEVELITESLMNNGGVLRTGNVLKYDAATSVTGLEPGDRIVLDRATFGALSDAYFATLGERFV